MSSVIFFFISRQDPFLLFIKENLIRRETTKKSEGSCSARMPSYARLIDLEEFFLLDVFHRVCIYSLQIPPLNEQYPTHMNSYKRKGNFCNDTRAHRQRGKLEHALVNLLVVVRAVGLEILDDLAIVSAHMLAVPAIAAAVVIWERRLQPFQCHVSAAHDGLPHVIEAVDHVPMVVFRQGGVALEARVGLDDGEEAVQLVGHAGGEDGLVGPDDGRGKVVVFVRVIDPLETHADCDALVCLINLHFMTSVFFHALDGHGGINETYQASKHSKHPEPHPGRTRSCCTAQTSD